ncbi:MAG: hypothetical protein KDK28_02545 [Maritimibacter sp.]|nr:hypothetical protein [Maritimibacter sp.]
MFQTDDPTPDIHQRDVADLTREDLLSVFEVAKDEGFHRSQEALVELLNVLDQVLGEAEIQLSVESRDGCRVNG